MSPLRAESRATTLGKWLLALVVPASALAMGSLRGEVLVVVSGLAALSCGLLWVVPPSRTSRASRWVLLAFAILLAMTVLQAIPLPAGLVRAIAPASSAIWERALSPLQEPEPRWHALSIAPAATRVEVLKGFFYGCVFLAAMRVASLEHGERFLTRILVAATSLMAFSALAHTAVSAETVFGVYRPRETNAYAAGRLSPLLNTNHLAAYLGMGACVALAAFLSKRSIPRALSGSLFVVLTSTSLWQGSRGATSTLLFGFVLTFGLTLYSSRRFHSSRVEGAVVAACAVAALIVVTVALSDGSAHLLHRDFSKVDVARRSLGLVAASPWFGYGRGGFESVFSSVREGSTYMTWTNPEDIVVQWLVDWGAPVTLLAMGLFAWALRPQTVLGAVRPPIGPWVAIVVAVLHDLVDFHLEVPGVVALVAVCAGIVVSARTASREAPKTFTVHRVAAFAVAAGAVFAGAFALPDFGHGMAEDRRILSAKAANKAVSREEFREDVRAAMLRYPAEPFFPLMGAVRAQAVDGGSVVPWVARALERSPNFGRAHFVLARSLAAKHAPQARLEYRLAYANDEALREAIAKEATAIVFDVDSALDLVPRGEKHTAAAVSMLEALVAALGDTLPSTTALLDVEIERRAPDSLSPVRRRAMALVSDAVGPAPWCANGTCLASAMAAAEELARRDPARCEGHVLVAKLGIARGEGGKALDTLERATEAVADRPKCQRDLIELALANGQRSRGDLALDRLVRSGCGGQAECLELYAWAASTEETRGRYARAVRLYRRILDLTPDREDVLQNIGRLGERDGLLAEGLAAYSTLAALHPADPQWPERIAALRARTRSVAAP